MTLEELEATNGGSKNKSNNNCCTIVSYDKNGNKSVEIVDLSEFDSEGIKSTLDPRLNTGRDHYGFPLWHGHLTEEWD